MPITPKCLSELFEAVSSGYIPIALNQRSSYILSGSLSIKEEVNSCFADISDLMKFMVETHWTVFFSAMVVNYFLIGRCPFYFKTGSIAFRGIKVKERYPQALLPGEYSYEKVITAGSVEPEHIFRMNGVMEQPKIYSISSQLFSGVNTSMVDVISSEMGYILDAWREHKIIMETAKTARARLLHPRRYIEYRPNNTIQKNDSQIAAYTDHLKTTDKNGYSLTKYEIIDLPNSSTSILPEDFSFCQHQHPVDFKLTETSEITRNYNNLVERALGLPNKELTKAKNRTQLVVDEEKATLIATLTRLIGDYSRGIKEVWRIMYGTSAEVHIPHRTHVNIDNVMMLLRMGGIDEESAGSEIQKITGVNARGFSKLHNEKLLKKQKREQIINE